jgi:transglutaminase-like putative cysteine protease
VTAVLDPTGSEDVREVPGPRRQEAADEPPTPTTNLLAELCLLGVSLATVVGYARLFDDGAFFAPIAIAAVLGHVLAAALRRLGIGPLLATVTHLAVLPIALTLLRHRGTTTWLLPTSQTLDQLSDDLAESWRIFLDVSAPVPPAPGFVIVAMATAWVVALASDSLAFRLDATVEALAPATGLFLFASILSDDAHRTGAAALFLVALLAFVLSARVARADGGGRWLATDAGRGARSLLGVGALLAVVAVVPAVIAGPRLPGGDGRPLIDLDGGGGDGDRVTLSPLVDIRARLVEQSDIVAFRVRSNRPAYWRLTALDRFDGQIWSSTGSYVAADGRLSSTPSEIPISSRVLQEFHIASLSQIWLPAAFEPISIQSEEVAVDYDERSSSLVVDSTEESSDGLDYEVTSVIPHLTPELLADGTVGLDTEFVERYTALPAGVARVVAPYVDEATAGVEDEYQRARALQDWFRDNFTYSLEVQPGHGSDALTAFLDPELGRTGYCEQFAGAYAAMARSLGLPARVAVGFTPGEEDEDDPGTLVVRGRNAHAWPEVFFSHIGWVAFEPTPGRGAPDAETYTGVPPQQAPPEDPVTATTAPGPTFTVPEVTRGPRADEALPDFSTPSGSEDGGPSPVSIAVLVLALGGGVWLVGVPSAGAARRARRRRRSRGHPAEEVGDAWTESVQALALLDVRPHEAETSREFAHRAAAVAGVDQAAHVELADLTTAATFGASTGPEDVARARRAAAVVAERCRRLAGPWRRLRAALSPGRQLRG